MFTHGGAGMGGGGCYGNTVSRINGITANNHHAAGGERETEGTTETQANGTWRNYRTRAGKKRGRKINERRLAAAESEEELRRNEDVGYRSQRGKSLLDICLDEIVLIPPGKLKVIV